MVCHSLLFKSFSQIVMIYTVKDFSVVNEIKVDVFLECSCFIYDPMNVGNFISSSSAFSKPNFSNWKFSIQVLMNPSIKDFNLTSMGNE